MQRYRTLQNAKPDEVHLAAWRVSRRDSVLFVQICHLLPWDVLLRGSESLSFCYLDGVAKLSALSLGGLDFSSPSFRSVFSNHIYYNSCVDYKIKFVVGKQQ